MGTRMMMIMTSAPRRAGGRPRMSVLPTRTTMIMPQLPRGGEGGGQQQPQRSWFSSSSSSRGGGPGGSSSSSQSGGGGKGRPFFSSAGSFSLPRDPGLQFTSVLSDPDEVPGPKGLPSRQQQLNRLQQHRDDEQEDSYDVLVIGGGVTGAGVALDAATRGLKVACIERGDFASETSSRSTKLIWAGIKYMGNAVSVLLSTQLFTSPRFTIQRFIDEMTMVIQCHTERRYMTHTQQHLCHWMPIMVPFTSWYVDPPPLKIWLYAYFPLLAIPTFKIYDGLSLFTCPHSYVLGPKKARTIFPQLTTDPALKYCMVYYEAMHNDARTNLAIALTAAEYGAHIVNYVEMIDLIKDVNTGKVVGATLVDRMTGKQFEVRAKKVVLAGGPFTDSLRQYEGPNTAPAVRAAYGSHIILPGHFIPKTMGILDYNTSDHRFMFVLPWQNHTLIGTTDRVAPAETMPAPPEDDIEWLIKEGQKYIRTDMPIRRSDVLSAWRGWRPLAVDPHAPPDTPVSRDHIISENPETGTIFIAGGKWTTWRHIAEDAVNRIVGTNGPKSPTLKIKLYGGGGYTDALPYQLSHQYGLSQEVSEHLANTYGGRAWEVCELISPTCRRSGENDILLVDGFPYIDAEVVFACREYAVTIEDVLSRRTRLAFLDKDAALRALPRVADIMAHELGWSRRVKKEQIQTALTYIESYGGRVPGHVKVALGRASRISPEDLFASLDTNQDGLVDPEEVLKFATLIGVQSTDKVVPKALTQLHLLGKQPVDQRTFVEWWKEHVLLLHGSRRGIANMKPSVIIPNKKEDEDEPASKIDQAA